LRIAERAQIGGTLMENTGNAVSAQEFREEGLRLFQEGLYEEAAAQFDEARGIFAAEGNDADAAEMVNNLGVIYRMLGKWDEAIAAMNEARETFVRLNDRNREAQTLGNLGGLYASRGERDRAQECLRQAADIFEELGDAQRLGETLQALGVQAWKSGDRGSGLATYEAGLLSLEEPTVGQKALRSLLGLRTKLLGGQVEGK
jgi:tetratricopeptide (TPR) repeat protein